MSVLCIRDSQVTALESVAADGFVQRVMEAVREYWPDECLDLGEGLAEMVRHGIARGESHRIVSQRGLFRYVNLMFLLGRDFDADPALPWAREILDRGSFSEDRKMDALVDRARIHARAAAPPASL